MRLALSHQRESEDTYFLLFPVALAQALYEVPSHRAPSTLKSVFWYTCAAVSHASPTGLGTSWMLYKYFCVTCMALGMVRPGNRDMVVHRAGGGRGLLQVRWGRWAWWKDLPRFRAQEGGLDCTSGPHHHVWALSPDYHTHSRMLYVT